MDLKKATSEYEVQMRNAIRAHKKCQDMAWTEKAIEKKIKDYRREVEERLAWIKAEEAKLAASKERHRIALEELQKTVPLSSQSSPQVKQEQQAAGTASQVDVEASSTMSTRGRKRRASP